MFKIYVVKKKVYDLILYTMSLYTLRLPVRRLHDIAIQEDIT